MYLTFMERLSSSTLENLDLYNRKHFEMLLFKRGLFPKVFTLTYYNTRNYTRGQTRTRK